MKVLVGFSGGVDSAMAALLLRERGLDVVAGMMSVLAPGDDIQTAGCGAGRDATAARSLAEQLGFPFRLVDCSAEYQREVSSYFRSEYLSGRTPNPCVRCNVRVKFTAFPALARAAGLEFDAFATGHYARIAAGPDGKATLFRGTDHTKDQSYFLYRLPPAALERTIFPLGEMRKADVRAMAAARKLPVHDKPDSQDYAAGGYAGVVGEPERDGEIVNVNGKVLGRHAGFWRFTPGQRKGLGVAYTEPLYVVRVEPAANRVVVGTRVEAECRGCAAADLVFPAGLPQAASRLTARVRSTQNPVAVQIEGLDEAGRLVVTFEQPVHGVAPGQSLVVYDGERVAGGGIIAETW